MLFSVNMLIVILICLNALKNKNKFLFLVTFFNQIIKSARLPCGRSWVRSLAESYLKTVKVGTRCLPAKHSALKGRIEGKWCKNQG